MTCPRSHLEPAADPGPHQSRVWPVCSEPPGHVLGLSQPSSLPTTPTPVSSPGPAPPDALPTPRPSSFSGGPVRP